MKPLRPFLLAALLLAPLGAQTDPHTQAITSCLAQVLQAGDFKVGEISVSGEGEGATLSGSTTVFGRPATLTGTFGAGGLHTLTMEFTSGAITPAALDRIAGGGLTALLGSVPLGRSVSLRRLGLTLGADGNRPETVTVGVDTGATWDPIPGAPLRIDKVSVALTLARPKGSPKNILGTVAGTVNLGAKTRLALSGTLSRNPAELKLSAKPSGQLPDLHGLMRALVGPRLAGVMDPMPGSVRGSSMSNVNLDIQPGARRAVVKADTDLGTAAVVVDAGSGSLRFATAFSPPAGFKLARLHPALGSLDAANLDLSGVTLVVASKAGRFEGGIEGLIPPGTQVVKGLGLLARLDLQPLKLASLLKLKSLDLQAHIPFPDPMGMVLRAVIPTALDLGRNATFREVAFELRPSPKRFKLGLVGKMDLRVDRQTLQMLGEMAIEPLTQTATVTMALDPAQGVWREPFGLRQVGVEKLAASFGVTFGTAIPLPTIGLQGGLVLGSGNDVIRGSGVLVLNPRDPLNSMVALDLKNIYLPRMIALADPRAADRINRTPLGVALRQLEIRDVNVRIVPNDIDFAGSRFERGFRFAGDFTLLGTRARGLFELDYDRGLSAMATVTPIRIARVFELTGARGRPAPVVKLDLRTDRQEFLVNGQVTLLKDMLGRGRHFYASAADLQVLPGSFRLYSRGKVLGVLATEVECSARGSFRDRSADFHLRARMENSLLSDLRNRVRNEIDKATRNHVSKINDAKRKVAVAQAKVNGLDRQIASTRRRVEARQARDIAKMRAAADAAKRKSQDEYNRLGRLISSKKAEINRLKRLKFPKNIGAGPKITKLGIEIGWLETRRRTQRGILDKIGSNLIKGLAKMGEKFPKELSSELGPMIASQKTAQASLIAAQGVLSGYRHTVQGVMGVAKWIADNGLGGVIDLKAMQFETRLATQRDSYVQVAFRGSFMRKGFTTGMRLDLRSPAAMASSIAKALIHNRAPNRRFSDYRFTPRRIANLAPPRPMPALTTSQILARAGSLKPVEPRRTAKPKPTPQPVVKRPVNKPTRPTPARPTVNLTGDWTDNHRSRIRVTQQGTRLRATMISPHGKRRWSHAVGAIRGTTLTLMTQGKRGSITIPRGHLTGKVLDRGRRIQWNNRTAWTRIGPPSTTRRPPVVTKPTPPAINLTGHWVDGGRSRIRITQRGSQLQVVMISPAGKRHWTHATGTIRGTAIPLMQHMRGRGRGARVSGTVLERGRIIKWSNGTAWTRVPDKPTPPALSLTGEWVDPNRCRIRITQSGTRLQVLMLSPNGKRWWTHASGTLRGSAIPLLQHMRGRSRGARVSGTVLERGRRIKWSNGTVWTRVK